MEGERGAGRSTRNSRECSRGCARPQFDTPRPIHVTHITFDSPNVFNGPRINAMDIQQRSPAPGARGRISTRPAVTAGQLSVHTFLTARRHIDLLRVTSASCS
ncbi:hypothetical protein FAGKG844_390037 [Frankia sp. AgKG'84/4]